MDFHTIKNVKLNKVRDECARLVDGYDGAIVCVVSNDKAISKIRDALAKYEKSGFCVPVRIVVLFFKTSYSYYERGEITEMVIGRPLTRYEKGQVNSLWTENIFFEDSSSYSSIDANPTKGLLLSFLVSRTGDITYLVLGKTYNSIKKLSDYHFHQPTEQLLLKPKLHLVYIRVAVQHILAGRKSDITSKELISEYDLFRLHNIARDWAKKMASHELDKLKQSWATLVGEHQLIEAEARLKQRIAEHLK